MRLTSFLLGGVVGAAAIVYMSRNNNNKNMMLTFAQISDNMAKMMDKVMMNFADKSMIAKNAKSDANATLGQVDDLMNKDPRVKAEVNEILAQNHLATH